MRYEVATQHTQALGPATEHLARVDWSPDGRYVILDAGTSIVRRLQVLHTDSAEIIHDIEAIGYAWSPDGRYLAVGQRHPLDSPISVEPLDSVSLAVWNVDRNQPSIVFSGSPEALYFPQAWLPDGRLLYARLDWDESSMTGEHTLWTITYVDNVAGAPQPAVDIPLAYDQTTLLERLPPEFQNAGSFSWSPDNQWVTFHAGDWPDIAIYLWHWEDGAAPYRLVQGASPQWQPGP